jgi:hypothetical protein
MQFGVPQEVSVAVAGGVEQEGGVGHRRLLRAGAGRSAGRIGGEGASSARQRSMRSRISSQRDVEVMDRTM